MYTQCFDTQCHRLSARAVLVACKIQHVQFRYFKAEVVVLLLLLVCDANNGSGTETQGKLRTRQQQAFV
jgi:hypothetical protein